MKARLKQCCECEEGKLSVLWKANPPLCRYHAQMRTAKKQVAEKKKEDGVSAKDDEFYKYVWSVQPHFCANCGRELKELNKDFIHHILPKHKGSGGYPYFRWDERNVIILCGKFGCHQKAENANEYPRMKIFEYCEKVKAYLLNEVGMTYQPKY